ncbi:vacuolar sorting protein [Anaeramoeba ignava]|uniref:Vacuolar sorting protein n=1 Tax=Anaeramoeba ignava TaxID=1746090 RepID=A0A9Q0LQL8_ANAIG|nr:vacuolar sorting protein [Anaeramoeba ignava]
MKNNLNIEEKFKDKINLESIELDSQNFDPVLYLNKLFPNEQSLNELESVNLNLRRKSQLLNHQIQESIHNQTKSGIESKNYIDQTKTVIQELFEKLIEIKTKSEQSGFVIQEICKDIKTLDIAKKNLKITVDVLNSLNKLKQISDEILQKCGNQEFEKVSQFLSNAEELFEKLKDCKQIPKILEMEQKFGEIKKEVRAQISAQFNKFFENIGIDGAQNTMNINEACLVVDSIGVQFRKEIIKNFCDIQLNPYQELFSPGKTEYGNVASIDRRYSWSKKLLRNFSKNFGDLFPEYWKVDQILSEEICCITQRHVNIMLTRERSNLSVDSIIEALMQTLFFEEYLINLFGSENQIEIENLNQNQNQNENENENEIFKKNINNQFDDNENTQGIQTSAQKIRDKYLKFKKQREQEEKIKKQKEMEKEKEMEIKKVNKSPNKNRSRRSGYIYCPPLPKFKGIISEVFEPFLDVYVQLQDQLLTKLINQAMKEEKWTIIAKTSKTKTLSSSQELFLVIRESLRNSLKFSNGDPLLDLSKIYKKHLTNYSEWLRNQLPLVTNKSFTIKQKNKPNEGQVNISNESTQKICLIINSIEYCITTTNQLSENISRSIRINLRNSVSFSEINENFLDTINSSIQILVLGIETKIDPHFNQMIKLGWNSMENVGDQSEYVSDFAKTIGSIFTIIGEYLVSPKYFKFLCDKLVQSFISRFNLAIFKCKQFNETGAQQLLLDTQSLKGILLQLPTFQKLSDGSPAIPSRTFANYVKKQMGKAELVTKVLITPPEHLLNTYFALFPSRSLDELSQIMDLKGMPKVLKQQIIDLFNTKLRIKKSQSSKKK